MTPRRLPTALALVPLLGLAAPAADDPYGDPVPAGARARLGTARMRNTGGANFNAVTPDGKLLVGTGPGAGLVYVEPATGKTVRAVKIEGEFGTVQRFSDDGRRVVGSSFASATVIDAGSGKALARVTRQLPSGENGVSLSADGKRLAGGAVRGFDPKDKDKDKALTAVVWDVDADKELASVAPAQNETVFAALSADGRRLVTWGYHRPAKDPPKPETEPSGLIQVWDAATGKEVAKIRTVAGFGITAVAVSPDGSLVASSGGDGRIDLFDAAGGGAKGQLFGRTLQGQKLAFSPDGKTLAAGGADGSVQRWNVADGTRTGTTDPPFPVAYTPLGIRFTAADRAVVWIQRGTTPALWEVPSGKLLTPAGGHSSTVVSAAVVGGGKEVITGEADGQMLRWDAAIGKELGPVSLRVPGGALGPGTANRPVTLSADGTGVLAFDGSGRIGIFDLSNGTQQFVLPGDVSRVSRGGFSADGTKVIQVLTSADPKIVPRVAAWDVATGKKFAEVELPDLNQIAAGISPDAKTLVTVGVRADETKKGGPGTFVVTGWEVGTNKKVGEFVEPAGFGSVYPPLFLDARTAVVTSPKSGPVVVDFAGGAKVRDLGPGGLRVAAAPALSPDRKTLAVPLPPPVGGNQTSSVLLIDVGGGKERKKLDGLSGTPSVVAFSPDGRMLVAGSSDTTALVWDLDGK